MVAGSDCIDWLLSATPPVAKLCTPSGGQGIVSRRRLCNTAGRNNISSFDNVMYLRQFKKLRLVNLAGNPIAAAADYRSYVLSHIKDLTYLDYRRVNAADVAAAMEQHQVSIYDTLSPKLKLASACTNCSTAVGGRFIGACCLMGTCPPAPPLSPSPAP